MLKREQTDAATPPCLNAASYGCNAAQTLQAAACCRGQSGREARRRGRRQLEQKTTARRMMMMREESEVEDSAWAPCHPAGRTDQLCCDLSALAACDTWTWSRQTRTEGQNRSREATQREVGSPMPGWRQPASGLSVRGKLPKMRRRAGRRMARGMGWERAEEEDEDEQEDGKGIVQAAADGVTATLPLLPLLLQHATMRTSASSASPAPPVASR
jgi:hypothetical protein